MSKLAGNDPATIRVQRCQEQQKKVCDGNFHLTLKDFTEVEPCKHLFLMWAAGEGRKRGSKECLCQAETAKTETV